MPFATTSAPANGNNPIARRVDQNVQIASTTPLAAKNLLCPRSCAISKVARPAVMKCCGRYAISGMEWFGVNHPPKDVGGNRDNSQSNPSNNNNVSVAPAIAQAPPRPTPSSPTRAGRTNSANTSAKPIQVHAGTAQSNAAAPNHLPSKAGTM